MCAGGEPRIGLTTLFVHVQIGDGTTTNRYSPVSVAGLSSGVAMVALGWVSCGCGCFKFLLQAFVFCVVEIDVAVDVICCVPVSSRIEFECAGL